MFWENLIALDKDWTLALNGLGGHPLLDGVMVFASHKLTWVPLYLALIVFLFYRVGWKKALVFLAAIGLSFLLCDQIAGLFKSGFERLRPAYDGDMVLRGVRVLEGRGSLYGFFSAHAANTFGLAACTVLAFRSDQRLRWRGLAVGMGFWAALVSFSRIWVGKHFLGDVLVGVLIGLAIGTALGYAARLFCERVWPGDKKKAKAPAGPAPSSASGNL